MPPLIGIDRGLNGEALKALEESGHGRRLAIVDASYNIPRWAQVVNYRGETTPQALKGVLERTPTEGVIVLMNPDPSLFEADQSTGEFKSAIKSRRDMEMVAMSLGKTVDYCFRLDEQQRDAIIRCAEELRDEAGIVDLAEDSPHENDITGFYSLANNELEDTLFIRTPDRLPYACATFAIGHSQVPEA